MIVGHIDQDTPAMAQGRVEAAFAALEMGIGFGEAVDFAVQMQAPTNFCWVLVVKSALDIIAHQSAEAAAVGGIGQKQMDQVIQ